MTTNFHLLIIRQLFKKKKKKKNTFNFFLFEYCIMTNTLTLSFQNVVRIHGESRLILKALKIRSGKSKESLSKK